jgi:arylsulfatase
MKKILLLSTWVLSTCLGFSQKLPNIIIIYMDDMGYGDVERNGSTGYTTPHFNQLAEDGLTFTQFYSPQAVCSASRAGLITGTYPNRIGMSGALDHQSKKGIPSSETTLAEMLKDKGYATAAFGKWHLGHLPEYLPTSHGFDEFFGIPYSNDMWPNHPVAPQYYPPLPLIRGTEVVETNPDQSRFTTEFTEEAIGFIQKNTQKPFFVYLAHPMPHVPLFVSEKFKGKSGQGLYGDVMLELDWSIGQIRQTLKSLNLEDNTLVIVSSDNGPWLNYGNHAGSAGGLREGKGTTWEGGMRVPTWMVWKGHIPSGSVSHGLGSVLDFLPTIAEITGASLPDYTIDGISLYTLLKNPTESSPRETLLYYYRQNSLEAIRHKDWKLVFPHPGRTYEGFLPGKDGKPGGANENYSFQGGLYDLRRDPGERYDVRFLYPEILKQLSDLADDARKDLGDDLQGIKGNGRRLN